MKLSLERLLFLQTGLSLKTTNYALSSFQRRKLTSTPTITMSQKESGEVLVVVGGGAAGVFGAIRAKTVAPHLHVLVLDKAKPLSKVKISGGGRCNVTNGHCVDSKILAENYPRGHKEFRGPFFNIHGPVDTMSWFSDHGVPLKIEDDGRVFPVSNSSSSIIDCLLSEAKCEGGMFSSTQNENPCSKGVLSTRPPTRPCRQGVLTSDLNPRCSVTNVKTGKVVTNASVDASDGKFQVKVEKRTLNFVEYIEADYLLIASGSSKQGYNLAVQLGHSIVDPVPSLFTFKIDDSNLADLAGVSFSKVEAKLKPDNVQQNIPHLTQVGPMLVTHWGLSGPAILRLSAWGARYLFSSTYKGQLIVDFIPNMNMEVVKSTIGQHKHKFARQKVVNSWPSEFSLPKRFWKYVLDREGLTGYTWASISNDSINCISYLLKHCTFQITGKGQFKDEFVTAGGVPLSEISLNTMESKLCPRLFFAGEVLNVDGVTGGFNFQNAWSGGYIAGTSIGQLAAEPTSKKRDLRVENLNP